MSFSVLVAEPSGPIANAIKKFLDGVAEVRIAHYLDEAVDLLAAQPFDVVLASASSSFDGEALTVQVRRRSPGSAVVLVFPPEDMEAAAARTVTAQAEGFLVAPLKRHAVVGAVRLAGMVSHLLARSHTAEEQVAVLTGLLGEARGELEAMMSRAQAQEHELARRRTQLPDELFFKKYMLFEVKRSKRYRYPVSLLVVGLDDADVTLARHGGTEEAREAVRVELKAALAELVRDVDITMPFAGDKHLVFLPHTPRAGAMAVAARVVERLRGLSSFSGGTASVGVACAEPHASAEEDRVSFGGLLREATGYLRLAQEAGGNRVEGASADAVPEPAPRPRKNRISLG